jgi:uncharacterized linocin/CFP29 family protein
VSDGAWAVIEAEASRALQGFLSAREIDEDYGSVVVSMRGGDYELVTGEDFSIGYRSHDADTVELYLEESLTFRVLAPEAAVYLTHGS